MAKVTLTISLELPSLADNMDNATILGHVDNVVWFVHPADDSQEDSLNLEILKVQSPSGETIYEGSA